MLNAVKHRATYGKDFLTSLEMAFKVLKIYL